MKKAFIIGFTIAFLLLLFFSKNVYITINLYTKEDEFFNIARKCAYALGYTNTPKAKEKLELLAQNENELIREYAIKQLNRHDFTDKDVEEQD